MEEPIRTSSTLNFAADRHQAAGRSYVVHHSTAERSPPRSPIHCLIDGCWPTAACRPKLAGHRTDLATRYLTLVAKARRLDDYDRRIKKSLGQTMRLSDCHNFHDFRNLAKRRLPRPIFDYIDGAADDEVTHRRNTASFDRCDLVPDVLRGVTTVDLSVSVMGQSLEVPFYCSPTALQRLFHHQGEHAVAAAASKCGTMFGVSSLGTVSIEELRKSYSTPQMYQFYFHKDRGLNRAMLQRAKAAGIQVMMLTVDSITGGNRERDFRTGFSIPFRLTLGGMLQFVAKPMWALNYVTHERFSLPQLDEHVDLGGGAMSIGRYFTVNCRRNVSFLSEA